MLAEHPLYTRLGESATARQAAYRDLFRAHMDETAINEIRVATASRHLLAGERFRKEIEAACGVRLGPARRGRPRKHGGGLDGEQLDLKI